MAIRVPARPEELDAGMVTATLVAAPGGWRLATAIAGGPEAHARAVGQSRVQMHVERAAGVLSQEDEQELAAGALTWQVDVPGTVPAMVRVALVLIDPVGRAPAPLFLDVAS
jgi:ethanolamine transporter EutH